MQKRHGVNGSCVKHSVICSPIHIANQMFEQGPGLALSNRLLCRATPRLSAACPWLVKHGLRCASAKWTCTELSGSCY